MTEITEAQQSSRALYWLIYYDDLDRAAEIFTDERAARTAFSLHSVNFSSTLFVEAPPPERETEAEEIRITEVQQCPVAMYGLRCSKEEGHEFSHFFQSDEARANTGGPWPWLRGDRKQGKLEAERDQLEPGRDEALRREQALIQQLRMSEQDRVTFQRDCVKLMAERDALAASNAALEVERKELAQKVLILEGNLKIN